MSVHLLRADARSLPLPDDCVDLVVTSPPYFGLRSYEDDGEHFAGQIGDEGDWREYLNALIACTEEWVRVLRPDGSLWVNLGDKYSRRGGVDVNRADTDAAGRHRPTPRRVATPDLAAMGGVPEKSLLGLPWRYALRCVDDLGLILRAEVVWGKPNGMPESITDRVRRQHETWFHFTLSPRYYAALDAVREPHTMKPQRRPGGRPVDTTPRQGQPRQAWSTAARDEVGVDGHPLGRAPGSVWMVPTQPLVAPAELGVDHYAAYPMELPRRIIRGWSPRERCTVCLEGLTPVVDRSGRLGGDNNPFSRDGTRTRSEMDGGQAQWDQRMANPDRIVGWACSCKMPGPTTPGVVLDPFGGTGTTAMVAHAEGRVGLSTDRSADYLRLATWRTNDPRQRALAAEVEYRAPRGGEPTTDQGALFAL